MHVAFHQLEGRVVRAAVLATAVLPAGQKVPHVVGGYHVFPLDAFCPLKALAVRVFARLEIATAKVDVFFVVVFAAAVKRLLQIAVIHAPQLLACIAVVVVAGCCRRVYARKRNRNKRRQN